MKHFADKVYFFSNGQIIVTYKLYFFKSYFMIFDDFSLLDASFKLHLSRFVDMTYLNSKQTEQLFSTLDMTNFVTVPHFNT